MAQAETVIIEPGALKSVLNKHLPSELMVPGFRVAGWLDAEHNTKSLDEIEAYIKTLPKLITMIGKLPHAKYLPDERVALWLDAIMSFEPERAEWHIKRLSGLGGSEIGTVVAPLMGEYDPFNTPRDIARDKLMITIPQPPNGHMKRGTYMEDMIRDQFRLMYSAVPLNEAINKMGKFRDPKHPWLVGNVDDFVEIAGKRFIVDYKCPMPGFKEKYEKNGAPFGYRAQLHHYKNILDRLNEPVDGLLLCSWDMVDWMPRVLPIDHIPELQTAIIEAGDHLWFDCIQKGNLPEFIPAQKVSVDEMQFKHADEIRRSLDDLSLLVAIANNGYSRAGNIKEEMAARFEGHLLGAEKLTHGAMEITAKPAVNVEAVNNEVAKQGNIDIEKFKVDGSINIDKLVEVLEANKIPLSSVKDKDIDYDALMAELESRGIPRERMIKESYTFSLAKGKRGPAAEEVSSLRTTASTLIDDYIVRVNTRRAAALAEQQIDFSEPAESNPFDTAKKAEPAVAAAQPAQQEAPRVWKRKGP